MAELMGRATGRRRTRWQPHICYENFYSNGVQGGIVPTATGMALAEKMLHTGAIATVFMGDGTLGEGLVYEAFNLASLWSAPILFVIENNRWSQSTPVEKQLAGSMLARGQAFGIESGEIDSTDAKSSTTISIRSLKKFERNSGPTSKLSKLIASATIPRVTTCARRTRSNTTARTSRSLSCDPA